VQRVTPARRSPPVILRRETRRAGGCAPTLLAAELLVVDRVRLAQPRVLLLGQRDVLRPATHAAQCHAKPGGDRTHGETLFAPQPPSLFLFRRFHERMFASSPDGENYTQERYAPMV
jgi:hypothetical protein